MESIRTAVIEKLRFFRGWMIYLPFLMLVMCNYVDQYFITFQGGDATKAYTLCMTVYWIVVAIGSVISIIMSTIIRSKLAIGNVDEAQNFLLRGMNGQGDMRILQMGQQVSF